MAEKQVYSPYRWVVLGLAWLLMVSLASGIAIISPLAKQLMSDLDIGHGELMAILGAPVIITFFASIPGGILADRFGYKRMVIFAGVTCGTFGILRGFSTSYAQFFIFAVLFGVGLAFLMPNLAKLVRAWFPPKQIGTATGLYSTGFAVGMTIGLAATYPLFGFNWRAASYATGALMLVTTVVWFFLARERKGEPEKRSIVQDLSKVSRHRDVWMCGLMLFFLIGGLWALEGQLPIALETARSVSPAAAGAIASMVSMGLIFGNAFGPLLSDRVGRRKPFVATCPIVAALAVYFAWTVPFGTSTWVLSFVAGIFIGTVAPLPTAIITEHKGITEEVVGTAVGLASTIMAIGWYLLTLLSGYISDWKPGYNATFLFIAIMLLLTLIFGLLVSETGHKARLKE